MALTAARNASGEMIGETLRELVELKDVQSAMAQTAAQSAMPDLVIPWELGGIVNDQNVLAKSTAVYGEMYFDLSDDTKLTVGARYQDDDTTSWT